MNTENTEGKPPSPAPPIFLKGRTTTLRPLLESDMPMLMRWINDPDLRIFLERNFPCAEKEEREWIERANVKGGTGMHLVIEVQGKPIGTMGLHSINWVDRTAVTGAMIGEKEFLGKGFGTDAKMALLEHAFNNLNLRKIYSYVIAFNKRSLRYSLHSGYELEGCFKKDMFRGGKYHDIYHLAITRQKWLPLHKKWKRGEKLVSRFEKGAPKKRKK